MGIELNCLLFFSARSAPIDSEAVPIPLFLHTGGFYSLYFAHSNEVMRYAFCLSILPEIAQSHRNKMLCSVGLQLSAIPRLFFINST